MTRRLPSPAADGAESSVVDLAGSSPVEVVLLIVGIVLTIGLIGLFVFVLTRKDRPRGDRRD